MKTRIISIDWNKIVEAAKAGHSAFTRSEANGHVYVSLRIIDKEMDQYAKDVSVLLNPAKEHRGTREAPSEQDGHFVGGGIILKNSVQENSPANPINITNPDDDLPF